MRGPLRPWIWFRLSKYPKEQKSFQGHSIKLYDPHSAPEFCFKLHDFQTVQYNGIHWLQNATRQTDSPSLPPSTCLQVLPIKRQRAADQCIEDDSKTPNVHLRPIVLLALEELRGSIGRRATERVQLVAQRELIAEAEVGYLDVGVGIQQKVLRLSHTNMDAEEEEAGMGGGVGGG